jgi:MFS family permease
MVGRIVFGMLADIIGISKTLLICMFLTIISVICYYIPYSGVTLVYIHSAVIGFVSGSLIPLLNSNLKELFETKYLSPLISFGGVFGLCGIAAGSAIMTLVANAVGIHHVQIVQIICFTILFVLYGSVIKNK